VAAKRRRRKKTGLKYSKVVVALLLIAVAAFTVAMIWIYREQGGVPDSLVAAFYAFAGGEAGFLGLIKHSDNKYNGSGGGTNTTDNPPGTDGGAGEKGEPAMKIIQSYLTNNPCYKAGRKITVKGLMLHSVGCPQPKASVFVKNWNSASYDRACVHGFIDANTGDIYQTLPWNHRGWHCGSGSKGSGNNTHIGVEMCEPATIKYTGGASFTCSDRAAALAAAERTYKAAVELFAHLCQQYGLDPLKDGVILSHREGHARGIASNHGDPEHLWKGLGMSYTMDTFRAAVKAQMGGTAPAPATPAPAPEKPATGVPYLVRVKITDLHIRSGPGTNYASKGFIAPGAYTIVEESTGQGAALWGKLKSGKGWIALGYTEKV